MTLTSTYDHRIIQGAASGEFLKRMGEKLLGKDGFFDRVFASLRIPYQPIRWVPDNPFKDSKSERLARVMDLIHSYRVRGHLMADTDPLQYRVRHHPDLDVETYGLTLWDLDRIFPTRGLGGQEEMPLRDILGEDAVQVPQGQDRKSTRLNSSHVAISYAFFCLKKKKTVMYTDNIYYY